MLLQCVASHKFTIKSGDVKTAFLQGNKEEASRDIHVEPIVEVRQKLNIGKEHILKLLNSVYGLRTAPWSWWKCVINDLESLGWRCHQLDQCLFILYDEHGALIGRYAGSVENKNDRGGRNRTTRNQPEPP